MNRILSLFLIALAPLASEASVPSFGSFDTNDFVVTPSMVAPEKIHTTTNHLGTNIFSTSIISNLVAHFINGSTNNAINYWTNSFGFLVPLDNSTPVAVKDFRVWGSDVRVSKAQGLALGTNVLETGTYSQMLLQATTANPADTILQLKAGKDTVMHLELLNYTNGNPVTAFTLPNNSPIADLPGGYVRLGGDWVSTNGSILLLRFESPDWVEAGRYNVFNPPVTVSENLWTNVTSVLYPTPPDLTNSIAISTNQVSFFSGSSQIYPDGTACIGPNCAVNLGENATQGFIYLQDGAIGNDTSFLSTDIRLQGLPVASAGVPIVTAPGLLWEGSVWEPAVSVAHQVRFWANMTPTVSGDPTVSYGHLDFWFTNSVSNVGTKIFSIDAQTGWTGTGTNAFGDDGKFHPITSLGSTTINPTDGYLPYRLNATTFADSPWYRISTNRFGFGSTNIFMTYDPGFSYLGLGVNNLSHVDFSLANNDTAIGDGALTALSTGAENIGIGVNAATAMTTGSENVVVGDSALFNNKTGSFNTTVGNGATLTATNAIDSVAIGHSAFGQAKNVIESIAVGRKAGYNNAGNLTNAIVIGYNATVTNNNDIVIGNASNVATFLSPELYLGAGGSANASIAFGPGTTNALSRSGADLVYTNGQSTPYPGFVVKSGDGSTARLETGGNLAVIRGVSGAALYDSLTSGEAVYWFSKTLGPTSSDSDSGGGFGSSLKPWQTVNGLTNNIWGFKDSIATNYSRLIVSHGGTNGVVHYTSESSGTAGNARPHSFEGADIILAHSHTPASSSETNYVGAITWDSTNLYIWTATNVNKKVTLTSW